MAVLLFLLLSMSFWFFSLTVKQYFLFIGLICGLFIYLLFFLIYVHRWVLFCYWYFRSFIVAWLFKLWLWVIICNFLNFAEYTMELPICPAEEFVGWWRFKTDTQVPNWPSKVPWNSGTVPRFLRLLEVELKYEWLVCTFVFVNMIPMHLPKDN